jgi:DNA repair protein RadC
MSKWINSDSSLAIRELLGNVNYEKVMKEFITCDALLSANIMQIREKGFSKKLTQKIIAISQLVEHQFPIDTTEFTLSGPEDVYNWAVKRKLNLSDQEHFFCLLLNTKNLVVGERLISLGNINTSVVSIKDVLKHAIISNCYTMVLVHNHPSGITTPSIEDLSITAKLSDAANNVGLHILDHVIIGKDFHSMKDFGEIK